ncbi:MAG TPA: dTDP-4-dehydrorhamnose reductase [Longimicrobiales bacterium]
MRVLVTGAGGLLGSEVVDMLARRGHGALAYPRAALDITDARAVGDAVGAAEPDAILHCAAYTAVDRAEQEPEVAFRVNADGTASVARAAASARARFVYVSTDYVFDGESGTPYVPDAQPNPLSVYARSKLEGERAARLAGDWMVARVSWVYGRGGRTFGSQVLARARAGEPVRAFTDMMSAPTWVHDAAETLVKLLERAAPAGIYHANSRGGTSWYGFACEALARAGVSAVVEPTRVAELNLPARRPRYSVMDVSGTEAVIGPVRGWRDGLEMALAEGL